MPVESQDDDLEGRLRQVEQTLAGRAFILEEFGVFRDRVAKLDAQLQPLLALSNQLAQVSSQLADLRTELAGFKGRAIGVIGAVALITPMISSVITACVIKIFKLG